MLPNSLPTPRASNMVLCLLSSFFYQILLRFSFPSFPGCVLMLSVTLPARERGNSLLLCLATADHTPSHLTLPHLGVRIRPVTRSTESCVLSLGLVFYLGRSEASLCSSCLSPLSSRGCQVFTSSKESLICPLVEFFCHSAQDESIS